MTWLQTVKSKGVAGAYRAAVRALGWKAVVWQDRAWEAYFHWKLGISTAGVIAPEQLGYRQSGYHAYDPVYYADFRHVIRALRIRPGVDVFVDFGSGKGRVLILAGRRPFRRVIGVELSPELDREARQNIQRAGRWLRCAQIETVVGDASTFDVPDDATILYFQNSFSEAVLDAVLRNIQSSLTRSPRAVRVVSHSHYEDYPFEQQIRRCEWLHPQSEIALARGTRAWVYSNTRQEP